MKLKLIVNDGLKTGLDRPKKLIARPVTQLAQYLLPMVQRQIKVLQRCEQRLLDLIYD